MKVIKQNDYELICVNEEDDFSVCARWDGCFDIRRYNDGYTYKDKNIPSYSVYYMHICEVREFIKFLTEVADRAEQIEGFDGYEKTI